MEPLAVLQDLVKWQIEHTTEPLRFKMNRRIPFTSYIIIGLAMGTLGLFIDFQGINFM